MGAQCIGDASKHYVGLPIANLQRFAFASSLTRSSTVVEVESLDGAAPPPQQRLRALCKGAPQRACVRARAARCGRGGPLSTHLRPCRE